MIKFESHVESRDVQSFTGWSSMIFLFPKLLKISNLEQQVWELINEDDLGQTT